MAALNALKLGSRVRALSLAESLPSRYQRGMLTKRLPISGFPHLALAAQTDSVRAQRLLQSLQKVGYEVRDGMLVPPQGSNDASVIAAITVAVGALS